MKTIVKSSIHIQGAVDGTEEHNARENFSYSAVFYDEKNEYKNNSKQAHQIFRPELNKRKQAYFNQVGQSLQVNTLTKLSGIINLHQHHTIENLKPIISYLEEKLDTIIYQIVIHRDEGKLVHKLSKKELYSGKTFFLNPENRKYYHDKDFFYEIDLQEYTIVKNYHSHIEMMGIDSKGKSIKRNRLHRYFLRELQTFVADTLKMPRGEQTRSYSKEQMKEIQDLTGPLECYTSRYEWRKAFNASAKSLGIYIDKTVRKDTGPFKEHGVIVQDLKGQNFELGRDLEYENFELEEYLECEKYEHQLTKDSYEILENKNSSLEDENSYLRDDIYDLRQGFQQIRRSLDIFYGVEYEEEEDITFEEFSVEETDRIVKYVDKLIDTQKNSKLQIKQLEKKNAALEEAMGSYAILNIESVTQFGKQNGSFAKVVSDRYLNIYKYFIEYLSGNYYAENKQNFISELQDAESELLRAGYKEYVNESIEVKIHSSNLDTFPQHKRGQEIDEGEDNTLILKN